MNLESNQFTHPLYSIFEYDPLFFNEFVKDVGLWTLEAFIIFWIF